ncbi:cyclic nucleotide-binding domain-containing protein [Streptomyces sp. NPDC048172]|uniref:cyclic nucleotide-binding domain-containing protein n=1 Tax=Streptomyces sp. NPDC048172 TaxID=3365505 RepID=UPI0037148B61
MLTKNRILASLPAGHGETLLRLSREVSFPRGATLFVEGDPADRFWILRSGTVALEAHVPGRCAQALDTLGHGDLVGWSWLFPPYRWHLSGRAVAPVHAYEFDARAVRELCEQDPVLGNAVSVAVARVVAHRLRAARSRLLEPNLSATADAER